MAKNEEVTCPVCRVRMSVDEGLVRPNDNLDCPLHESSPTQRARVAEAKRHLARDPRGMAILAARARGAAARIAAKVVPDDVKEIEFRPPDWNREPGDPIQDLTKAFDLTKPKG